MSAFRRTVVEAMDELEDLLQRYRPAGPPAELRDRITSAAERDVPQRFIAARAARVIEWLPAAAALILAVLFSGLAAGVRARVEVEVSAPDPDRETVVRALVGDLGGSESARETTVRLLIDLEDRAVRAEAEQIVPPFAEVTPQ